jgi:hypothetical protein
MERTANRKRLSTGHDIDASIAKPPLLDRPLQLSLNHDASRLPRRSNPAGDATKLSWQASGASAPLSNPLATVILHLVLILHLV